ncbi:MAG: NAD(P)H-dependent oxidoreductase subunit E [Coriobacteriia bacterium]|nr:NAD(P)H-dependent oxidoreductase subunit E [Coriobacteriia bacterium]MCL2749625.1 NAD(P)H-dependent oxidoreductase subunit E [Coriobacteriia bacterium]
MIVTEPHQIQKIMEAYPAEQRYALAILQDIQNACNYLPEESLALVSGRIGVPVAQLYSLATFYKALSLTPKGKHIIKVCDGTACHMCGSSSLLISLKQVLGVEEGELTADGQFSYECVNCVGSCALAPVMVINANYYAKVNTEKLVAILEKYQPGGEFDE